MGLKVQEYYSHYVNAENIITVFDLNAAHTFVRSKLININE